MVLKRATARHSLLWGFRCFYKRNQYCRCLKISSTLYSLGKRDILLRGSNPKHHVWQHDIGFSPHPSECVAFAWYRSENCHVQSNVSKDSALSEACLWGFWGRQCPAGSFKVHTPGWSLLSEAAGSSSQTSWCLNASMLWCLIRIQIHYTCSQWLLCLTNPLFQLLPPN